MSVNNSDLEYKIDFQARINMGKTLEDCATLQGRLDGLIQTGEITDATYNAINAVLDNFEARLKGANEAVLKLDVSTLSVKNRVSELTAAATAAAKAVREKEAADKAAAVQADKDAAAEEKRAVALERTAKAAAIAAKALAEAKDSQAIRADTVASRYAFNSERGMAQQAQAAEGSSALSYVTPTAAGSGAVNQELFAQRQKLIALESEYAAKIERTTGAFRAQMETAAAEGKILSGPEFANEQEYLRQEVVKTTDAYKMEIDQVKAAGIAIKEQAGFGAAATRSAAAGGSIGSFYPMIMAQRVAVATSAALLGVSAAAVKTSVDYEAAFANVSRTMNTFGSNSAGQIEYVRRALMDLDKQVPLSFTSLSKIAAMGNELGVSAGGILSFTKTAAQYSTVTGTSAEQTANALGSLNEILDLNNKSYQNLGASISYVGRMSVASEPEVVTMLQKIAANAHQAGMSSQDIIGLSAALASLKEPPERAQGALQTYFKIVNEAVAQGGMKLQNFATFMGITTQKAADLAKTDPTAFLKSFLTQLNEMNSVDRTRALDALHLSSIRTGETLTRLSGHMGLLNDLMKDAGTSWAKGTDLQDQFAKKTDTLAAKMTELSDGIQNLLADLANSGLANAVKVIVEGLGFVVNKIDDFVKTAPYISNVVMVMFTVVGAILAVRGAMIGFEIAAKAFGALGFGAPMASVTFRGSIRTMIGALFGWKGTVDVVAKDSSVAMGSIGAAASNAGRQVAAAGAAAKAGAAGFEMAGAEAELSGSKIFAGATSARVGASQFVAAGGAAEYAGAGFVAGGDAAIVGGTGFAIGEALATAGISVLITGISLLVGWLITDFPSAMQFGTQAFGWFADGVASVGNALAPILGGILADLELFAGGVLKVVDVIIGAINFITSAGGLFADTGFSQGVTAFGHNVDDLANSTLAAGTNADAMSEAWKRGGKQLQDAAHASEKWADGLKNTSDAVEPVVPQMGDLTNAAKGATDSFNKMPDASGPLNKTGNAAAKAAKEVRTLVDWANDLQSTFARAFDIRTGPQSAADAIGTQFLTMKKNALDAKDAVQQARDKIKSLQADISKAKADNVQQKYFLSVANQFGDSLRAPQIQSQIDTNNNTISSDQGQLPKANSDLADAEDKASKSLSGNTAGAIANRQALNDLAQKYQDYIVKLAASGASQAQVEAATKKAKAEFVAQATQLGYNKSAVDKVAKSFDDMTTIVKKVPRNVTVTANANPALQAINEFAAKAEAKINNAVGGMNKSLGGIGKGLKGTIELPKVHEPPGNARDTSIAALEAEIRGDIAYMDVIRNGFVKKEIADQIASLRWSLNAYGVGGYADGGFTGPGGKYEPAGIVHKGEYVVPQHLVNQQTGLPYADALGRLPQGTPVNQGYSSGGFASGSDIMVMELGPKSIGLVRQAVAKEMAVYIGSKDVTNAVNKQNSIDRRRGRG